MAALYMDGFDHYNGNMANLAAAGWSIDDLIGIFQIGAPAWGTRTGPACLIKNSLGSITDTVIYRPLPAQLTDMFLSFGYSLSSLPPFNRPILRLYNNVGTTIYELGVTVTGAIYISGSTISAQTAGPVITPQNWHFLEMEFNTAGNFTLRVDDALGTETPILITAMNGGSIAMYGFMPDDPVLGFTQAVDDVFVRDTTGDVNNSWLGDRRIAALYPDADDTTDHGWTPHFYKQISVGHARLANVATGFSGTQSLTATINASPATALNLGNQEFTLESFVRFDRLPVTTEKYIIFNKWNENDTIGRSYQLRYTGPTDGNVLEFRTSTDGTSGTVVSKIRYPWQPEYGTWYHVALCRVAGELLLFVDGEQLGLPIADTDTYFATTTSCLSVGSQVNSASFSNVGVSGTTLVGRLDETRFTNGVGRYTASFTPPTAPYPRGSGSDPDWSSVVLLMGYDQTISDESSFNRPITAAGGAFDFIATDGNPPGDWTAVGKSTPDDNTFIRASLTNASNIYTLTTNPSNGNTVTVGTKDGVVAAVYTFVTALANPYDVFIGATAQDSLTNLLQAINAGTGSGTLYGTGTLANADVLASNLPAGQIQVTALTAGTIGNSIAVAETSPGVWANPTNLDGGANIPGRSSFKLTRPPTNTTIISAIQLVTRAKKTDSGVGSFRAGLIGPLGGIEQGPTHALTVSGVAYSDIIETDPDTTGPISPTTLVNGRVSVNRTA